MNITPLIIILILTLSIFGLFFLAQTFINYFYVDKKDRRNHDFLMFSEKEKLDIIKKFTKPNGDIDTNSLLINVLDRQELLFSKLKTIQENHRELLAIKDLLEEIKHIRH